MMPTETATGDRHARRGRRDAGDAAAPHGCIFAGAAGAALVVAPFVLYPVFLMKVLCFALFACAFNLLLGYVGLLSFGHAAFSARPATSRAHAAKVWGLTPELAILARRRRGGACSASSSARSRSAARASTSP